MAASSPHRYPCRRSVRSSNRRSVTCPIPRFNISRKVRQLPANPDLDATLAAIITPIVTAMGFDLVRIWLGQQENGQTLQIMAEDPATGQLTLDQCAAISRALDLPLEEADPIPFEYALEVSSPGIDRPLTRLADYDRWQGHDAKLTFTAPIDGRARASGVLAGRENAMVALELKSGERLTIAFGAIAAAKLVLTDRLIAASRPIDTAGADEIVADDEVPANDNIDAQPAD